MFLQHLSPITHPCFSSPGSSPCLLSVLTRRQEVSCFTDCLGRKQYCGLISYWMDLGIDPLPLNILTMNSETSSLPPPFLPSFLLPSPSFSSSLSFSLLLPSLLAPPPLVIAITASRCCSGTQGQLDQVPACQMHKSRATFPAPTALSMSLIQCQSYLSPVL